jgi:hypothetical protein
MDSQFPQELSQKEGTAQGFDISRYVVTVSGVAPGHQNSVGSLRKRLDYIARVNHSGAEDPHGPGVGFLRQP